MVLWNEYNILCSRMSNGTSSNSISIHRFKNLNIIYHKSFYIQGPTTLTHPIIFPQTNQLTYTIH